MRSHLPALLLGVALTATACAGRPSPDAPAAQDWEPLGAAVSPCGRYTLRLEHAEWTEEKGKRPSLRLQMAFRPTDDAVFPCGRARIVRLVTAEGVEFGGETLGGHAMADARWGTIFANGLSVYRRGDHLRRLRVECRVMRVLTWRTYELAVNGPGESGAAEYRCPPWRVSVGGDEESWSVSAYCSDDLKSFPSAQRELFGLLGNDWVASGVEVRDAEGTVLLSSGGHGSGGFATVFYRPPFPGEPGADEAGPIVYPLRGTLRLPEKYVIELVMFEFDDLLLVR